MRGAVRSGRPGPRRPRREAVLSLVARPSSECGQTERRPRLPGRMQAAERSGDALMLLGKPRQHDQFDLQWAESQPPDQPLERDRKRRIRPFGFGIGPGVEEFGGLQSAGFRRAVRRDHLREPVGQSCRLGGQRAAGGFDWERSSTAIGSDITEPHNRAQPTDPAGIQVQPSAPDGDVDRVQV